MCINTHNHVSCMHALIDRAILNSNIHETYKKNNKFLMRKGKKQEKGFNYGNSET
jgi:hypothetical protein